MKSACAGWRWGKREGWNLYDRERGLFKKEGSGIEKG